MFLKPTPEKPEQAHRPGKTVRFSVDSQVSSPIAKRSPLPI